MIYVKLELWLLILLNFCLHVLLREGPLFHWFKPVMIYRKPKLHKKNLQRICQNVWTLLRNSNSTTNFWHHIEERLLVVCGWENHLMFSICTIFYLLIKIHYSQDARYVGKNLFLIKKMLKEKRRRKRTKNRRKISLCLI